MTHDLIRSCLLAATSALLLSGASVAQQYFYSPSDTPTTGTCNVFPWGQSSTRHQHIVSATELGNVAQTISDIAYAGCNSGTLSAGQILIRMNHTTLTSLTTDFTVNLGAGAVTVLNATSWAYNYTANAWADVGLTGTFGYDPAFGNLIIDIEFCGASGGSSFHRDVNPRAWLNGGTCPSANNGTAATGALKVRVCSTPPASYFYAPSDTPTTGTCNVFPWGQSSTRHQHLVTAAELGNAPRSIRDLGYAACASGTFTASQILIRMNHFNGPTLTNDFANNLGAGAVTMLNTTNWSYAYTANAWADIGLTGAFNYDPALGNLVIDIEFCGGTGGSSFHRDVASRHWLNGGTCPSANNGTAATGALKVRVCTSTAGSYSSFGSSCGVPAPVISGTGVPNIGASANVGMSNGLAGALGFYLVGNFQVNLDLGPSGAPGCTLYTLAFAALPTLFDAGGNSPVFTLGIPNVPALVGGSLVYTGGYIDPPANFLGINTANGLTMTIGI